MEKENEHDCLDVRGGCLTGGAAAGDMTLAYCAEGAYCVCFLAQTPPQKLSHIEPENKTERRRRRVKESGE